MSLPSLARCLLLHLVVVTTIAGALQSLIDVAEQKFEKRFHEKCDKFKFVSEYNRRKLARPSIADRYAIFVLHEKSFLGGLGDRLGGLITAFAFAARTNRTFLIEADSSFSESFAPYDPKGIISWRNLSWSGLTQDFLNQHSTITLNCINPKPRETKCALDEDRPEQIVRIRVNRSYLCRWMVVQCPEAQAQLAALGLTHFSDLFEASGCMMRLAMWPKRSMWERVIGGFAKLDIGPFNILSMHFRCGDLNFKNNKDSSLASSCMYGANWVGVDFGDAKSEDSPMDMSSCAKKIIQNRQTTSPNEPIIVYIASDNEGSVHQMNQSLAWDHTYIPKSASCHVDLDKSGECSLSTLASWFTLAISDEIILQSIDESGTYFIGDLVKKGTFTAASAFSRYAAIYSLTPSDGGIHFAKGCSTVNSTAFGYITQGNWMCTSKIFF